ncbi:MAG: esterase family protein, partial [Solirubrobacterales bacterium]|nr:esterase family protein [Solirubrobacterales bacterium]
MSCGPRRLALALAGCLTTLLAIASAAAAKPLRDYAGLRVIAQRQLDSRLSEATISTPAIKGQLKVRILVPAGYRNHRRRRYPVLYLLDGTSGFASDWTTRGGAEQTTAGRPLIVVMPDITVNGNGGGWCTDWYNGGAYGQPKWETFHIGQLIPWVDRNLRTVASRRGRAIAGLSQGGFCSMSYPARHPDLFSVALSYSGAPDIAYDREAQLLVTPVINGTETGLDRVPANSMFGPRTSQEINWAAHDPATLAPNLRPLKLFLFTGNGQRGPYDPLLPNPYASGIESGAHELNVLFHRRLGSLGIPSFYEDYGGGTHIWPYWARDLRQSIGPLMADFRHPPRNPTKINYMSAENQYSVFGWRVRMHRAVREFSTLRGAGKHGFILLGSGSATVITPAVYRRHARYRITIRTASGTSSRVLRAGRNRRLKLQV